MKAYQSIKEAAEDLQISERQAWRWLKQGRIKKKRSEDDRIIFVLVDELSDNVNDNVTDSVITDTLGVGTRRVDRKLSVRPGSGSLAQSMRDELEAAKIEFEVEKVEDARAKWQERKDRERKEKAEQERIQRLDELRVRGGQHQAEEKEFQKRNVIQKVKNQVIPAGMRAFIPTHILAFMYQEIEKVLSKTDVFGLPFSELVVLAKSIRDRVIEQNNESVRESVSQYLMALSLNQVKESLKQAFNEYREHGGELCYRDWLLTNAGDLSPEKQREFLNSIGL